MGSSLRRRQQFEFQYQCPSLVWKCEKIRIGCEGGAPASASASTACDDDALIVRRRSEERPSYYGSSYWYLMMMQVEAMVKQVGWRNIRSRWRQRRRSKGSRGGNVQYYNYDLRSYAQNFDDGRRGAVHDDDHRPSRFAP